MKAWIRAIVALASLVAAASALAQKTTELHARSYVLSAFITGAAHAIVADNVTLAPSLRERLGLSANADSRAIYEALIALTENKPLAVRTASTREIPTDSANTREALIALEAADVKLFMRYDLERNNIAFISDGTGPAPAAIAASESDGRAMGVTNRSAQSLAGAAAHAKIFQLAPIPFEFDQAILASEAKARLEQGLPKLANSKELNYVVRGYADDIGKLRYNEELSRRRAEAVRDYLVAKGADPAKIEVLAYGSAMPQALCPTQLPRWALLACHAPNRRVEVEIHVPPR